MVDIHTHILHGVDDGAETFDDALEMLEAAYKNGTTHIVLTPHYLSNDLRSTGASKDDICRRFEDIREAAESKFEGLRVYLGAETFAATNIFDYAEKDLLLTINGTRYLLLEFGFDDSVSRALDITRELQRGGLTVIVAHPERYNFFLNNPQQVLKILDEGALLQLNASSIMGHSGVASRNMALSLIDSGLAAFVASDAHSVYFRPPDLAEAYSFVSSTYNLEFAEALFERNPGIILNNGVIV